MTQEQLNQVKFLLQEDNEKFNIFSIMRMETDEVHTHSAFIAFLLDPKGSHGKGDLFLKLFFKFIPKLSGIENFDTTNAVVDYEYVIGNGNINKDYTYGGRIDLLIQSGDTAIIVENKIYAEDQEKQLYRYKQFAERSKKISKYHILYLTLGGKKASRGSLFTMFDNEYTRISYKEHIQNWIKACLNEPTAITSVREAIAQYSDLISKLTTKKSESPSIIAAYTLCAGPDDMIKLRKFKKHFDSLLSCAIRNQLLPQLEDLAKKSGLILYENGYDWDHIYKAFSFRRPEWETFEITFLFGDAKFSELRCGFRYIDKRDDDKYPKNDTYDQLVGKCGTDRTSRWPSYRKCKGYSNWQKDEVIFDLYSGKLFENIERDFKNLLDIVSTNHLSL
ncbi:MAG: PD-(D/E)XK nuclease family protein [Bacteroidales bacterium]|nr:PD-(D/E)XK nuclease family protein [Bacteroidales bacterium]